MAKRSACEVCGGATFARTASARRPYHYTLSGLRRVFLIGLRVESCRECGMESPEVPQPGQLHRIIARSLIHKQGRLAGDELRFLRKLARLAAKDLAGLLRVTPEHLSGAENDRRPLGPAVDKLVRAIVAEAIEADDTRAVLLGLAAEAGETPKSLRFRFRRRWTGAA